MKWCESFWTIVFLDEFFFFSNLDESVPNPFFVHRFWLIHCALTPKLIIYRFPVTVQQWLSIPIDLSLQPRFTARDSCGYVQQQPLP